MSAGFQRPPPLREYNLKCLLPSAGLAFVSGNLDIAWVHFSSRQTRYGALLVYEDPIIFSKEEITTMRSNFCNTIFMDTTEPMAFRYVLEMGTEPLRYFRNLDELEKYFKLETLEIPIDFDCAEGRVSLVEQDQILQMIKRLVEKK